MEDAQENRYGYLSGLLVIDEFIRNTSELIKDRNQKEKDSVKPMNDERLAKQVLKNNAM